MSEEWDQLTRKEKKEAAQKTLEVLKNKKNLNNDNVKNKTILLIGGIIFLLFSYLQINDSYSFLWIIAYLIPAMLSFALIFNNWSKYFQYLSPVYLIIAINLYFNNSDVKIMHIFSESTNEILGLILCSIWIFILPLLIKNNNKLYYERN